MALLSRKGLLAIAAVIDVALHGRDAPVSAKVLAERHALPARHLEPVLQALLRAAGTIEDASDRAATAGSTLLHEVVIPAVGQAERAFSIALARINLDELVRRAEALPDPTA